MKKKAVAVAEEPPLKKKKEKKIIIRNKGITISENCILDSVSIEPTITTTNTPSENQPVSDQTTDQIMTDIPEQNTSVSENIVDEQVVSERTAPENMVSEQNVSEQNASEHIVSEHIASENTVSEQNVSEQVVSENNIFENIISEQNIHVSENINPDHTPSENLTSVQPQTQSSPQKSPEQQASQQEIPVDEIHQNSDQTPENNYQIVPVVAENLTPLATLVDLTLSSDTETLSAHQSETSSGSSFNADEFIADLMSRRVASENRFFIPPSLFPSYSKPSSSTLPIAQKKPIVGKMLRNLEYEMKKWFITLNKECSESHDPIEANQLFSQFRKKFSSASAAIHDIVCKNAWKNLQKKINARILYLKEVPEFDSYTEFSERFAAAKAAEKAFMDDALLKAELRIAEYTKKVAAAAAAGVEHTSDVIVAMDTDEVQKSVEDEVVVAAEKEIKDDKPEDSVDLKAWMANQEKVTSELQKSTAELQKSSEEMKSWMVQQGETSSKIENLLAQLLAKNS